MSFLDRFKPQPRWKHADPTVRAAAVAELLTDDPEQQRALVELAGEPTRTSGCAARLARASTDGRGPGPAGGAPNATRTLRRELTDRLVGRRDARRRIRTATPRGRSAASTIRNSSPSVAKSSPHETVRAAALGRVHDVRTLSSVARHALDPQTALEAVARVADPAELLNIALKTEHKDAGIAALERLTRTRRRAERSQARSTGCRPRAKNKSVAKRAQDDGPEHRRGRGCGARRARTLAAAGRRPCSPAWRRWRPRPWLATRACSSRHAESDWLELAGSGTFAVDPDTNARFGALVTEAHGAIERFDQAQAERRAAEERRASLRAAKHELCERVEALRGEDTLEALDKARGEWEGLINRADATEPTTTDVTMRTCTHGSRTRAGAPPSATPIVQAIEQIAARLGALSQDAERIASADPFDEDGVEDRSRPSGVARRQGRGARSRSITQRFADAQTQASHNAPPSAGPPKNALSASRCSASSS